MGVLEIENRTGRSTHAPLADTIRQTVLLTLNLLDLYEVIDRAEPRADDLSEQAAAIPADTLLWGEVSLDEAGRIEIEISIFDRLEGRIVLTETRTAPSLLDVFDSADRLVGDVIGSFSGARVGFGTIRLNVSGTGSYRIFLNGTDLGENVETLDRVLAGEYTLRVVQAVPEGFRTVLEEAVSLEDNSRVTLTVELLDTDSLRVAELRDLAGALEPLLGIPPGPGPVVAEMEGILARYERYDPDPQLQRWYRYRVDLQREYRGILDFLYFDDSQATFDRTLHRELLATTYELHQEVSDDTFSEEQWRTLDELSLRNRITFYGVMMLAADYQTVLGNVREQTTPYDVLFALNDDDLSVLGSTTHRPFAERTASLGMREQHTRAVERQRPFWHNVLIGAGAMGVTTAGFIFATGMPWDRIDEGDRTYEEYKAADTPDEAKRLREETQDSYDEANLLFAVGGTAGILGVTALTTGIVARVRSVRRPQRILDGYIEGIGDARLDAAISFFEDGDQDRLILVRSTRAGASVGDRRLHVEGRPEMLENGPSVLRDISPGTRVSWRSTSRDAGEFLREHVIHPGRNVIYVP